jgi:hypothetical protein
MQDSDLDMVGPSGEILHLEDIASIRSISINSLVKDSYFVDVVDLNGVFRKNYMCSFHCLNYTMLMLFVEGDKEDKTNVSISFESLMALLTKSRHIGYDEGAGDTAEGESSEDAMDELMKREPNIMLN